MYLDLFRLNGKTALVTGGGGAIGLATCHALAEAGAKVIVADMVGDAARKAQEELKGAGFDADMIELDVTKPDAVRRAADELNSKHGAVDILVANAGHRPLRHQGRGGRGRALAQRHRRQPARRILVLPRLRQAHAASGAKAPS